MHLIENVMDQHLFMDTKFWVCFRIFWNNANSQFNCFAKQKVYQTRTSTSDNTEHRKKQFMVQYPSCYKKTNLDNNSFYNLFETIIQLTRNTFDNISFYNFFDTIIQLTRNTLDNISFYNLFETIIQLTRNTLDNNSFHNLFETIIKLTRNTLDNNSFYN